VFCGQPSPCRSLGQLYKALTIPADGEINT
jgi:hypothetical protein